VCVRTRSSASLETRVARSERVRDHTTAPTR
jgi:hypothetical protein